MHHYREKFGLVNIDQNRVTMEMDDQRRISIDSHNGDSEEETEDERKKWLTHLNYDPKSLAE
jgi:hypothetical protein